MLRDGELDAVIVGNDVPDDPSLRTVFPDPEASAEAFWGRHHLVPVNHMVTIRRDLTERHPDLVAELMRMFQDGKAIASSPNAGPGAGPSDGRDPLLIGRTALEPAVGLALRYAAEQGLLPRQLSPDEVWA
jgi:4,5-dihydroxyphthalate decarboxylase